MMRYEEIKFQRFDQVRLRTTVNVKYMSAPPDTVVSPMGMWSVAAIIPIGGGDEGHDLLLVKHNVTIRIPSKDVLKVSEYDVKAITAPLGRLLDGQGKGRQGQEG